MASETKTPTQLKSAEERMLIKAANDFQKIMESILGAPVKLNLSISGALDSKVDYMGEINNAIVTGPNRVRISREGIELSVYSKSHMPF